MADLLFHTRPGCGLCDRLLALLDPCLAQRPDLNLKVVNIQGDDDLETAFGLRIPVLTVDGNVILEGRPDAVAVEAALRGIPKT